MTQLPPKSTLFPYTTLFRSDELRRIFRDTEDMIRFFETRAGVRYADETYTQVLAAQGYGQEMSGFAVMRSEEHTSELQSLAYLVCRLLLEKKNTIKTKLSLH